jgi:L-threonylcarbamoyladenylate synthase
MIMEKTATILQNGGVGILATDTLYGLVGSALDARAVERVYRLKRRRPDKPCIVLVADMQDLELFEVAAHPELDRYWPGPVSVVVACLSEQAAHLHRGTQTLALRLPDDEPLRELLRQTGPLIAPSANPEGLPPAQTLAQARDYFGETVDFYVEGQVSDRPSKLIAISDGEVRVLRG